MKIDETFLEKLPCLPPKEAIEHYKKCLSDQNALIYQSATTYFPLEDRKRKCVKIRCSACGDEYYEERFDVEAGCGMCRPPAPFGYIDSASKEKIIHGDNTLCPSCGAPAEAYHVSKLSADLGRCIADYFFNTVSEIEGKLCILSWALKKHVNIEGKVNYITEMGDGNIFDGKKSYAVSAFVKNYNPHTGHSLLYKGYWRLVSYEDRISRISCKDVYPFDNQILTLSGYDNCKLDLFIKSNEMCNPVSYMDVYIKHPQIENLVTNGLSKLLQEKIYGEKSLSKSIRNNSLGIDFKESKPYKMLRLNSKTELEFAKKHRFNNEWLSFFADYKDVFDIEYVNSLRATENPMSLRSLAVVVMPLGLNFKSIINYILNQKKRYGSKYNVPMYTDYIKGLLKLKPFEEISKKQLKPKNLKTEHDNVSRRIIEIEAEKKLEKGRLRNSKIVSYAEHLSVFSFNDENYSIKPCPSDTELYIEGETLEHCVYSYGDDIADRKTAIFFLRKVSSPNEPFFTLEYNEKNSQIVQNLGYDNCDPPDEVIMFTKKWLNFCRKVKEQQENAQYVNENQA